MHRTLVAVCAALAMSGAMLGAQKPSDTDAKTSDATKNSAAVAGAVTFTGCLSPGSNADSFYLTSAKQKGVKSPAQTVKIVPATKKVDLDAFVTHEVEVTGTLEQAGTAAASTENSGTAPTLTVTKVKSRSDGC